MNQCWCSCCSLSHLIAAVVASAEAPKNFEAGLKMINKTTKNKKWHDSNIFRLKKTKRLKLGRVTRNFFWLNWKNKHDVAEHGRTQKFALYIKFCVFKMVENCFVATDVKSILSHKALKHNLLLVFSCLRKPLEYSYLFNLKNTSDIKAGRIDASEFWLSRFPQPRQIKTYFTLRPHQLVSGSTGPGYSLLHFRRETIFSWYKQPSFLTGISAAIKQWVYIW